MTMGNAMGRVNPARSIAHSIANQESELLRKGELSNWKYSQIRQRHLYSTFHFNPFAGPSIEIIAGVPTIVPGEYGLFQTLVQQNGQGLPGGLMMSLADTDALGAGRVPDDQNFSIWEIGATVMRARQDVVAVDPAVTANGPVHPDDVDRILCEGIVSVQYLTNKVPYGHCLDYAQPGGPGILVPSLLSGTGAAAVAAGALVGGLGEGSATVAPWNQRVPRLTHNGGNGWANPGTRRKLDIPIFLAATTTWQMLVSFTRPVQLRSLANGGTQAFSLRIDLWAVESFRTAG